MDTMARPVKAWMHEIEHGRVQLPRFQRSEVWNEKLVAGFFDAILRERPLGVFLVLTRIMHETVKTQEPPCGINA